MTTNLFRGLLLATTAAALLAASNAQAADAPTPKLTSGVVTNLQAAEKAAAAKDWPTAVADLDKAKAVSGRTPFDDYKIAQVSIGIEVNAGNLPAAQAAAEAAATSTAAPDAEKQNNLYLAVVLTLNNKDYDKSVTYSKLLLSMNPTDSKTTLAMGQAFALGKDYADGIALTQKGIDATVAAGGKPDRNSLEMLMTDQVGAKDEAGAEKTLEMLVANYNDPSDWTQMIDIAFGTKGLRDVDGVWLGRLMFLSGATVSPQDATMIGQTASHLTFFGDAQQAQQKGGTGFPDANAAAAKDKASMTAQIAVGQGPKGTGTYNAKLAEALYGYGMYPEAEAAARLAIQKGGMADTSEAPMVLGQTLVAEGKYDDAIAAFGQVTGGGPATPRVTRLWTEYANIKKNPPGTATAAAPATAAK
jgi:tetratricopeptide (TPR) repeat protein